MPFNIAGGSRLRNMRDQAIRQARRQFDPNVLDPQRGEFQRQATQGIGRLGDTAREGAVTQMFSPTQFQSFAGNQGRALSAQQDLQGQQASALAQFERGLSQQDIQTRQQGRQGVAQTESQQRQIQAQQDASIEQAELQYQAERDRRRQQMVGAGLGIAGSLLTTPFGGGDESLLQRGLGSLFGGGEATEGTGSGMERFNQLSNFIGQDFSGEQPTGSGGMDRFNQLAGFLSDGMVQPMQEESSGGMDRFNQLSTFMDRNFTPTQDIEIEQEMIQHQRSDMGAIPLFGFDRPLAQESLEQAQRDNARVVGGRVGRSIVDEVAPQIPQTASNLAGMFQGRVGRAIFGQDEREQQPQSTEGRRIVDGRLGRPATDQVREGLQQLPQVAQQAGEGIFQGSLSQMFFNEEDSEIPQQIRRNDQQEQGANWTQQGAVTSMFGEGQPMSDFNLEEFADTVGQFEGFSETAYPDTLRGEDVPTIGFGTTRYPDGSPVQMGDEISSEQAREFKLQDLQQSMQDAERIVPNFNELPDEAKGVVIDMIYNLGASGFSQFENMIDALTQNDFARAAQEAENSLWFNQVGNRARTHIDTLSNLAQ